MTAVARARELVLRLGLLMEVTGDVVDLLHDDDPEALHREMEKTLGSTRHALLAATSQLQRAESERMTVSA